MEAPTPKGRVPGWMLGALATAAVSLFATAATVWNNSSLHATQIATLSRDYDRAITQIVALQAEVNALHVKMARMERDQDEFSQAAIEKLDAVLKQRHRR